MKISRKILGTLYRIITHGPYGDGKGMYAELCGIGEMWGYIMGVVQEYECYSWQLGDKFLYLEWNELV